MSAPARARLAPAALATLVALAAGCASKPDVRHDQDPAADCAELSAGIEHAEQALREAQAQQSSAWKALVPFAVIARHAQARSAGSEAQQQLDALRAAQRQQACDRPAG